MMRGAVETWGNVVVRSQKLRDEGMLYWESDHFGY